MICLQKKMVELAYGLNIVPIANLDDHDQMINTFHIVDHINKLLRRNVADVKTDEISWVVTYPFFYIQQYELWFRIDECMNVVVILICSRWLIQKSINEIYMPEKSVSTFNLTMKSFYILLMYVDYVEMWVKCKKKGMYWRGNVHNCWKYSLVSVQLLRSYLHTNSDEHIYYTDGAAGAQIC